MKKLFIATFSLVIFYGLSGFTAKPVQGNKAGESHKYDLDLSTSKVMWVGRKVVGPHNGTISLKEGSVTLVGLKPVEGLFVIDMKTIKNEDLKDADYNKKLVDHLASDDFFAVEKYPTSTFKLTKTVETKKGQYTLTGNMTIKDVTKSITFPVTVSEKGGVYTAAAKLKINRTDWGVKYNSSKFFDAKKLGDKIINDEIEIEFNLKTKKM